MSDKVIASLVGKLRFEADYSALLKFEKMLDRVAQKMDAMTKKAEIKLGIKPKAEKSQTAAQAHNARMREHKLEVALARAKKATFAAELQGQKLQFAGQKESQALQTATLRTQQQQAILAEKAARAQQAQLKADGVRQKNAITLEQAKIRQARLEKLLEAQQAKTNALKTKELREMTALQRAEMQLQQLRAAGARQVRRDNERRAQQQRREAQQQQRQQTAAQRQETRFQQSQQRFQWAQQRHQAWEANKSNVGAGFGFDALAVARNHPIIAGLAGVATALYALQARLDQVQDRVSSSEQYENIFRQIGGKNPDNVKFVKDRFFEIGDKYGTSVDKVALEDFRKYVLQQVSLGKSLEQAAAGYELQQAAFRGAGMDKTRQERAAYQLSQIQAKGRPEGADVNDLFDAAPLLATPIRQAAADRFGFKGAPEELAGWFKQAVTDAKITAADFNQGMANFVRDNADIIAIQQQSIDAAKQRLENDKIIQQVQIDQSEALKASIHERIAAERELVEAMKPVREALAIFDTALMKATASVLNFYFKTPEVSKLEADVKAKQDKVESIEKWAQPDHPALQRAEKDLAKAKRKLTDVQVKQGIPVTADKAPGYLLNQEQREQQVPEFLQKLEQGLMKLPQNFISPLGEFRSPESIINDHSTTNTTRVVQVTAHVAIDASSADDVKRAAKELELQVEDMAKKSFDAMFTGKLDTAKTNLVQTKK
ncbi:tape measure protein [Pseudomonas sp. NPDC077649]|uniref:tape measure protein n=1 Tax=Pseudomonas sp. NPDC077649 TaxID=3364423 RepID=UPI0037CC35B5